LGLVTPSGPPGRTLGGFGPLRLLVGHDRQPTFGFASAVSVPWRSGLEGLLESAARLIGDTSIIPRTAVELFDTLWQEIGGDIRVELAVDGDELFGWSLAVKKLLVPRGWRCEVCHTIATDVASSLSHRSQLPVPGWKPGIIGPLEFKPITTCSRACLEEAARTCLEATQCQIATRTRLDHIGRRLPPRPRTLRCSA
jgi:hypothetical protein